MTQKFVYDYPHPAVTADCVVFGFDGRDLKVLLIERGFEPCKGMWAFPGGFMQIDETAEECAVRELQEETGLVLTHVRQIGAFSGVHRDPRERIVTIAFYALARQMEVRGGDDAAKAHWWSIGDIPQLAFDHDYILRRAMSRLRQDIHFEPVGFGLLEEHFTIADLQRLYESILGVHFDRRNFYSKMLKTGILQEVDEDGFMRVQRTESIAIRHTLPQEAPGNDTPAPQYFGKHREMKCMNINDLFGAGEECAPLDNALTGNAASAHGDTAADGEEEVSSRTHTVGRRGKLFRFDKESYNRLKDGNGFRLEF